MEFFDSLVLNRSSEHIALLHYILMTIYFIFLPFSGLVLSGTLLSLIYKRKGEREKNNDYIFLAKNIIQITTINKSSGIILGVLPAFSLLLIYSQLLHSSGSAIISFLFVSFVLYLAGILMIYIYRYAFIFNDVFKNATENNKEESFNEEYVKFYKGAENLKDKTGLFGLIFLAGSLLLILACVSLSINTTKWQVVNNLFSLVVTPDALLRYLFFIVSSLTLTGAYILFINLYWGDTKTKIGDGHKKIISSLSLKIIFVFTLLQPAFLFLGLFTMPDSSLSSSIFIIALFAVLLTFMALNIAYILSKEKNIKLSGYLFIILILVFASGIIKDQAAMSNSGALHALVLNSEYEKYFKELQASGSLGDTEAEGKRIFNKICSTCHKFDQKLVGPPYKETLPKYEGKIDELAAFISNPVKKNQNYPPMPNQGIKMSEAKAVAKYIMNNYKK